MKSILKAVKVQFEALNFANDRHGEKICYLKLGKKVDPYQFVNRIQNLTKYGAFIPDYVPHVSIYVAKDSITRLWKSYVINSPH